MKVFFAIFNMFKLFLQGNYTIVIDVSDSFSSIQVDFNIEVYDNSPIKDKTIEDQKV